MSEEFHLHYLERGEGPVLVLLHGNGEDSTYFEHQMDAFASSFHVYALDTRGHGQSPRGEGEFTIRRFADDLSAFLEEKKIHKASILGFSDGANIAMCFSLKYPEKVEKLILDGGNMVGSGVKFHVQAVVVLSYFLLFLVKRWRPQVTRDYELLRLMVKDPALSEEDLKSISAPTLVMAGDKDMFKDKHT
ncbi:MAG: alpha/beta hydrolase, partial [Spirochaetales bacterium]|nr:alpha/beta hydrolase [Candidatus Physcosoma equi]